MSIASITQTSGIDISNWLPDEQFFSYPEGARPKLAYFPPPNLSLPFIKPYRRYLYKGSSNAPDDQFWAEIVAYKIGCQLGVVVPETYAAYNSMTGSSGALIEWFYTDDELRYTAGGDFMKRSIPDFDGRSGRQHNLFSVITFCRTWSSRLYQVATNQIFETDYIKHWGEAFLFDALIGNTDRHQNNWGVTLTPTLSGAIRRLSPLFDNGTSLGSDRFIDKLNQWPESRFISYVENGTHHMKLKADDDNRQRKSHAGMIKHYIETYPEVTGAIATFTRRLPPRRREDFKEYLQLHKLPADFNGSDFALLSYTGAKLPSDGFEIFPDLIDLEGPYEFFFEVAGTRYLNVDFTKLNIGDPIDFKIDERNPYDPNTINIYCGTQHVGFAPKPYVESFKKLLAEGKLKASIEKLNSNSSRPLVFLFAEVV